MEDFLDSYDAYDDYGDEDGSREVRCKRCRERGLYWDYFEGAFRLIDDEGRVHECPAASADEFDTVKE